METIVLVYFIMIPISYVLITGLMLGYNKKEYHVSFNLRPRPFYSFVYGWSLFAMLFWPIMLPYCFFASNMAEHGLAWK